MHYLSFQNNFFILLLFCTVSSIEATIRNCTNYFAELTVFKEMISSEEWKYCRYLKVNRLLKEQSNAKTIMQTGLC